MEFNPFSLQGKVVLVTGASSGIGCQCAIDCSRMGAKVALVARDSDRLKSTLSELDGNENEMFICDLDKACSVPTLVQEVVKKMGKIDGFIHAAGIEITKPVKLLETDDYERVMRINTFSAAAFVKQFSNIKYFNKGGAIVLISSIAANIARGGVSAYSASKGALVSMSRVMAIELAKKGIRVNCVSPGTILTPLMENYLNTLSDEDRIKRVGGFPLGLGDVSDVSNACLYLLSDASKWVTGQNLIVDGGYTAI